MKWLRVISNSFAEHQTLNIKLLSITWNISMLWRVVELACGVTWSHAIPLLAMLSCSWSLNLLCICWSIWHPCIFGGDGRQGYLAETTKNTNRKWNGDLLHDVIECQDCRETITWCSRCVEESSLRLAVKQSQFGEFLLFFPPILHLFVVVHGSVN